MPNPHSNQPEVNLDLARMFIDQLAMIQEKTRGNLSNEEANVLRNALSNLQMAFYEVAQQGGGAGSRRARPSAIGITTRHRRRSLRSAKTDRPRQPSGRTSRRTTGGESKKRFSKSYGG